jgi:hypothetical protein
MARTKEELQEMAQLVRVHEANCNIPYPTPQESNFRLAIAKELARRLGLKELRGLTIDSVAASTTSRQTKFTS